MDPEVVAKRLPPGVTLDTRNGNAWVGVVPFLMSDVAPRLCPPTPGLSRFPELNVRTYVTVNSKPGVWFFSLDAASRFAVRAARATFNLPYMDATMSINQTDGRMINYISHRTHLGEVAAEFEATYFTDDEFREAEPGTLNHWLTARYCLYCVDRRGRICRGEIDHPPWKVATATCDERVNTMGEGLGFSFSGPPHLLMAEPIEVRAWLVRRCSNE